MDFLTVAIVFNYDAQGTKGEIRSGIFQGLTSGNVSGIMGDEDCWAWSVVKPYRAGPLSKKLAPPGKVYRIRRERDLTKNQNGTWNGSMRWTVSGRLKAGG